MQVNFVKLLPNLKQCKFYIPRAEDFCWATLVGNYLDDLKALLSKPTILDKPTKLFYVRTKLGILGKPLGKDAMSGISCQVAKALNKTKPGGFTASCWKKSFKMAPEGLVRFQEINKIIAENENDDKVEVQLEVKLKKSQLKPKGSIDHDENNGSDPLEFFQEEEPETKWAWDVSESNRNPSEDCLNRDQTPVGNSGPSFFGSFLDFVSKSRKI